MPPSSNSEDLGLKYKCRTFISVKCLLVGLSPLIQQVRPLQMLILSPTVLTIFLFHVTQGLMPKPPCLMCAFTSPDWPQFCVGFWPSAAAADIPLGNLPSSSVEDVKIGNYITVLRSLGSWLGWVSGNASRGDMEKALAGSPTGRKGIWEEITANAKSTEKLVSRSSTAPGVVCPCVAEYIEAPSGLKSG